MKMASQKNYPSFTSVISVLSIALYCGGFLRVELQLNKQNKRIDALETDSQVKPREMGPDIGKIPENSPGKFLSCCTARVTDIETWKQKMDDGDCNNLYIYLITNL